VFDVVGVVTWGDGFFGLREGLTRPVDIIKVTNLEGSGEALDGTGEAAGDGERPGGRGLRDAE